MDTGLVHCLQEIQGSYHIVPVVQLWLPRRLTDVTVRSKVTDSGDLVFVEDPGEELGIESAAAHQLRPE
jgi:hypothetical protein